jgi:hypothetical protein
MAASVELTAQVHAIIRRTISPHDLNQAVKQGVERQKVQAGSITLGRPAHHRRHHLPKSTIRLLE